MPQSILELCMAIITLVHNIWPSWLQVGFGWYHVHNHLPPFLGSYNFLLHHSDSNYHSTALGQWWNYLINVHTKRKQFSILRTRTTVWLVNLSWMPGIPWTAARSNNWPNYSPSDSGVFLEYAIGIRIVKFDQLGMHSVWYHQTSLSTSYQKFKEINSGLQTRSVDHNCCYCCS